LQLNTYTYNNRKKPWTGTLIRPWPSYSNIKDNSCYTIERSNAYMFYIITLLKRTPSIPN